MLRAVRAMLHAELPGKWANIADAPHLWRKAPFILLLAALMIFGCFPRLLTDKIAPSAALIVQAAQSGFGRELRRPGGSGSAEADPGAAGGGG